MQKVFTEIHIHSVVCVVQSNTIQFGYLLAFWSCAFKVHLKNLNYSERNSEIIFLTIQKYVFYENDMKIIIIFKVAQNINLGSKINLALAIIFNQRTYP